MTGLMQRRRALTAVKKASRLPAEYQEVEWIKANDSAYIKTEVRPHRTTLYCDFSFPNPGNSQRMVFSYASDNRFYTLAPYDTEWAAITRDNNFLRSGLNVDKNRHSIVFNDADGNALLDGSIVATSPKFDLTAVGGVVYLFSGGSSGFANNAFYGDVVFVDKDTGNEIGRIVPCYRKADGEIGVYDLVNMAFYPNYNTVGYFTKGNDI